MIIRASEEYRGGPVGRSRANRDVSPNTDSLFFPEGEYWTIAYEGQTCRLRDSKGLRYLAHLLRHPAERFSAADLIATDDSTRRRTLGPSNSRSTRSRARPHGGDQTHPRRRAENRAVSPVPRLPPEHRGQDRPNLRLSARSDAADGVEDVMGAARGRH